MAVEREPARRPDVDEIGRNTRAARIVDPPMRKIGGRKKRCVDDEQRKADVQQRRGNLAVASSNRRAGWGRSHAASCSRRPRLGGARTLSSIGPIALRK